MAGNQVEPVHGFDSLLIGENAAFLDEQYRAWLDDPGSVAPQWAAMFGAALDALQAAARRARAGTAPLIMRPAGEAP